MGETIMSQTFKITGLTCAACTKLTAKRIKALPGVDDANVDLETGKAEVLAGRKIGLNEVQAALAGSNYRAGEYHD